MTGWLVCPTTQSRAAHNRIVGPTLPGRPSPEASPVIAAEDSHILATENVKGADCRLVDSVGCSWHLLVGLTSQVNADRELEQAVLLASLVSTEPFTMTTSHALDVDTLECPNLTGNDSSLPKRSTAHALPRTKFAGHIDALC